MEERDSSFLIDLEKVKLEKQLQTEKALEQLIGSFISYIDNEVNIREMVRAKQIFSHKTSISKVLLNEKSIKHHFNFWFGFDYITVIGSRLFDIFIRERKEMLSKPMLDLSGFLMLMYLQPVIIIGWKDNCLQYKSYFSSENRVEEGYWYPQTKLKLVQGKLTFIRVIQAGGKKAIIGPPIIVDETWRYEVELQLDDLKKYNQSRHRKYLKEHGIDYLTYEYREG